MAQQNAGYGDAVQGGAGGYSQDAYANNNDQQAYDNQQYWDDGQGGQWAQQNGGDGAYDAQGQQQAYNNAGYDQSQQQQGYAYNDAQSNGQVTANGGAYAQPQQQQQQVAPQQQNYGGAQQNQYGQQQYAAPPANNQQYAPQASNQQYPQQQQQQQQQYAQTNGYAQSSQQLPPQGTARQTSSHLQSPQQPHYSRQPATPDSYQRPDLQSPASQATTATPSTGSSTRSSPRIDPAQIPHPDRATATADTLMYYTRSGSVPPPASKQFVVVDEGNCSPRFVRLTTNNIAHEAALIDSTRICIGAVIQPLADVQQDEEPVPVVDPGKDGPVRCHRCRAYVNPFFKFVDNGKVFICNMCGMKNDVPHDYICNLDANGFRRDKSERHELCRGSVEFVANADYITREIQDPCFLFVVDVSYSSIATGLLQSVVNSLAACIDAFSENPRAKIGVMTYDTSVHFYNLKSPKGEPEMLVTTDLDSAFVPVPTDSLLVSPAEEKTREPLDALLALLPEIFQETRKEEACAGSAVAAAAEVLSETGGKILLFQSSLPTIGEGTLKKREDASLYGTDKERTLFKSQNSYYEVMATRCAERAISVDIYACANQYIDLATVGVLSRTTGGQIYYYPGFSARKDQEALLHDIHRNLTRNIGFDGIMLVRTSRGLKVADQHGHFFMRRPFEMELPSIDADKTFAVRIEHDDNLEDESKACVQIALLYTTQYGERRIRVHTLTASVTSVMSNIFRSCDIDAIINLSLKQTVYHLAATTFKESRQALVQACVDILFTYRRHCAHASSSGQLILPESLKLLPLYTLGLIKNSILADKVTADERAFLFSYCTVMTPYVSVPFVYPHLYSLHDLDDSDLVLQPDTNRVSLPQCRQLTVSEISSRGLYLLDNGRNFYISVGNDANREILSEVFDVPPESPYIDASKLTLLEPTDDALNMATRVFTLMDELRLQRPNYPRLTIMEKCLRKKAGMQSSLDESAFLGYLVEDDPHAVAKGASKTPYQMSYPDFLCHIHRRIQDKFL